jgi:hypothetical protein
MATTLPYEEIVKKFHVGDRVRLINGNGMVALVGATATIVGYEATYEGDLYYVSVKWDRNTLAARHQCDGGYYADDFELVDAQSKVTVHVTNCPRCGGELFKKQTEYCGIINKCKKCGWC